MDFGLRAEDPIKHWIPIKLLHAEEVLFRPTRAKMASQLRPFSMPGALSAAL